MYTAGLWLTNKIRTCRTLNKAARLSKEESLLQPPETKHHEVNTLKLTLQSLRGRSRNDPLSSYSLYKSGGKIIYMVPVVFSWWMRTTPTESESLSKCLSKLSTALEQQKLLNEKTKHLQGSSQTSQQEAAGRMWPVTSRDKLFKPHHPQHEMGKITEVCKGQNVVQSLSAFERRESSVGYMQGMLGKQPLLWQERE